VRAYLDLFRMRMGRRLTYSIDAASEALGAEFPPMLLLTLVENAVKHGLEPARGGGHVAVTAAARAGARSRSPSPDSGVGFDAHGQQRHRRRARQHPPSAAGSIRRRGDA